MNLAYFTFKFLLCKLKKMMLHKLTVYFFVSILFIPFSSPIKANLNKKAPKQAASKINCSCGKSNEGDNKLKIVGGKLAANHIYPWMGALIFTGGLKSSQFCGSSLINDRWLVTAGHCVERTKLNSYQVYLGSNKINGTDVKTVNILSIILHPNFNAQTLNNDIALIKLAEPVKFTSKIRPVCLAGSGSFVGKLGNVAGWGTQEKGGNSVNQLRDASVKVLDNSVCNKNYSSGNVKITENMICATLPGRDSCSGDSGGPLMVKEGGDTYKQIGIVSFGIDCGNSKYPGVYTRISRYHKWIMDNTKDGRYCSK